MSNPYNYHVPVQSDDMFFGRARLLGRLADGLMQATPISAALFGGRRVGKTSLLRWLERGMVRGALTAGSRRLIPWYYDPQAGYPIACSDDFSLLVLEGLRQALCEDVVSTEMVEDTYGSALRMGPVHAFEESFLLLAEQARERIRLVMLIDEAEALLSAPWGADLRPNLRNLLSNSRIVDRVALVMSGSTAFHTQVAEKDSPLENILTRYALVNLTHRETLALAQKPTDDRLSPEAAEEVWAQTGGHPCLVQFVMQELWRDLPEVGVEDVQDVATTFPERLDHFERWSDVLSLLAHDAYRWLIDQEEPVSYLDIRRALPGEDGSDLQRALTVLAYHGLIQVTGRGPRTRYAVAGHMFRDWYLSHGPDEESVLAAPEVRRERPPVAPLLTHETFDLEIETQGPGRYEVQVLNAPVGPVRSAAVAFDPAEPAFQAMLERIEVGDVDGALLTEVGQRLHAFLFPGRVWASYVASREAARRDDRGLWVKLRVHQPELSALPWELIYDTQEERFMALSGNTPLTRSLPGVLASPLPPVSPPWRLLIASAAPVDYQELDVAREREGILDAIAPLVGARQVRVERLDHATTASLHAALRAGCHWLHFIGHGVYDARTLGGALILERGDGTGEPVGVDTLRHLLLESYAPAGARLRMVFLNACRTAQVGIVPGTRGLAQTLVRAGVPTAIGMGRPIADDSARAFSEGFYSALAERDRPPYLAVAEGRQHVMAEVGLHSGDWAVPVLFTRG